eukprot:9317791-Pyramimonas_sp.AAC.1
MGTGTMWLAMEQSQSSSAVLLASRALSIHTRQSAMSTVAAESPPAESPGEDALRHSRGHSGSGLASPSSGVSASSSDMARSLAWVGLLSSNSMWAGCCDDQGLNPCAPSPAHPPIC